MPTLVDDAKLRAANAAADLVEDGMTIGLGSGTTAALVVRALGLRMVSEGLRFVGVPTSDATADLARKVGIPLRDLDDVDTLDLNLDGADEIDPEFQMIKGRGGALLREKIVVSYARRRVTVVTAEKRVPRLGSKAPIPVEVSPFGTRHVASRVRELGAEPSLRLQSNGSPYLTDGGNKILDCAFPPIEDAARLNRSIREIVGVFETGIFVDLCDVLIVGYPDRVERLDCPPRSGKSPV